MWLEIWHQCSPLEIGSDFRIYMGVNVLETLWTLNGLCGHLDTTSQASSTSWLHVQQKSKTKDICRFNWNDECLTQKHHKNSPCSDTKDIKITWKPTKSWWILWTAKEVTRICLRWRWLWNIGKSLCYVTCGEHHIAIHCTRWSKML